ncbi:MAG: autotransporter assembly complex protein TamA [Thiotrichales bacterium]
MKSLIVLSISLALLIAAGTSHAETQKPRLTVTGADKAARENIRAFIDMDRFACDIADWRLQRINSSARKSAQQALHALGYYQASVETSAHRSDGCWTLTINTIPGERALIKQVEVNISGGLENTLECRDLLADLPVKPQTPLSHADYELTKQKIESLASHYGYFDGEFTRHELRIQKKRNSADVVLDYASGDRYRLGDIHIGETQLSEKFLQSYIKIRTDDFYNSQDLTLQQQLLANSGYFASVEVAPDRNAMKDKHIPVSIELTPRKRHAYRIGAGISTDAGPRATFDFENRWVNRRGHHYQVETLISRVIKESVFNYTIPLGDAGNHKLDLSLGYKDEDSDTSKYSTSKYSARQTRVLGNQWRRSIFLDYLIESFATADARDRVRLLTPGLGWNKTQADSALYPRSGWRLGSQLITASQRLFSDLDLTQVTGSIKVIRPWGKARLIGRGSIGATKASEFSRVPASLRFFAGGDSSVRGFGYKKLGPKDDEGNVIGGRNLLTGSLEVEFPVRERWGLAAFFDAGNAFNDYQEYQLKKAAGIGIRFHSPVGPVRVDIARDIEFSEAFRIHLSMGPDL